MTTFGKQVGGTFCGPVVPAMDSAGDPEGNFWILPSVEDPGTIANGSSRRQAAALLRPCPVEWQGLDSQGTPVRADLQTRRKEADEFYATVIPRSLHADAANVMRQALAGMLWSKQFYHYDVDKWLESAAPTPSMPRERPLRGTTTGITCTTATSFPCRTSGSTPGTRHGIWRFTCSPSRWSTSILASSSSN